MKTKNTLVFFNRFAKFWKFEDLEMFNVFVILFFALLATVAGSWFAFLGLYFLLIFFLNLLFWFCFVLYSSPKLLIKTYKKNLKKLKKISQHYNICYNTHKLIKKLFNLLN